MMAGSHHGSWEEQLCHSACIVPQFMGHANKGMYDEASNLLVA
jgi:hypothetical protein